MFNTKLNNEIELNTIPMNEMKPCQIGIIISSYDNKYNSTLVMRTASTNNFEIMDLTHPGTDSCWSKGVSLRVQLLQKGDSITLTVE